MENVEKWISNNFGDGSGSSGYGSGTIAGSGSGSGYGYGSGSGSGSGYSYSYGYGGGPGSGSGSGDSYGSGDGSGSGYDGIKTVNGKKIYLIDNIPTLVKKSKYNVLFGWIFRRDFTLQRCYVVKGNGYFAHGRTVKDASGALQDKFMEDLDKDEIFEKFLSEFKPSNKYTAKTFFNWHHFLTGSCLLGRKNFVKNHGIKMDDEYSVQEFFSKCKNDYGGGVIRELESAWNDRYGNPEQPE